MAALMGKTTTTAAEKLEGQSSAQVPRLPRSHRTFAARIPRPRPRLRLEDIDAEIPVARRRKEGVLN